MHFIQLCVNALLQILKTFSISRKLEQAYFIKVNPLLHRYDNL